ncbi:MAG: hypothetical protein K6G61_06150 [Solobacterium sp.]|nr:hypothetical protein [Solobacterium sp.]
MQYPELFSRVYQSRIRVLLESGVSDDRIKQRIMSRIYEKGQRRYEKDPAAFNADILTDFAGKEIQSLISIPTGMHTTYLLRDLSEEEKKTAILFFQENRTIGEIARQLDIPAERAAANIASARAKVEEKLKYTDLGDGVTAVGFLIGMLKAYPAAVPAAVPPMIETPGRPAPAPRVVEAGGRGTAPSAPVSSHASAPSPAVSGSQPAVSAGNAVPQNAAWSAANAGPVSAGNVYTASGAAGAAVKTAGGMTAARIAATAAIAVTAVGGGGYGIYRIMRDPNKKQDPAPEVINDHEIEEQINTPLPEEIAAGEKEKETTVPGGPGEQPVHNNTPAPAAEAVDPASLPDSLSDFLMYCTILDTYDGSNDYDSARALDYEPNILAEIMYEPIADFSQYPVEPAEYHMGEADPMGWYDNNGYSVHDGPSVDWIAANIFNVSESDIRTLCERGEESRSFKREEYGGSYRYYSMMSPSSPLPNDVMITEAEFDGTKYYLTLNEYYYMAPKTEEYLVRKSHAAVEDKVIGGSHYWSLYVYRVDEDDVTGSAPGGTADPAAPQTEEPAAPEETAEPAAPQTEEPAVPEGTETPVQELDPASMPDTLNKFLSNCYISWGDYREYDYSDTTGGSVNILASIMSLWSCVDYSIYPVEMPECHYGEANPMGWTDFSSYFVFDGPSVDWIAVNIFHVSESDLDALCEDGEAGRCFIREYDADGSYRYISAIPDVGVLPADVKITSVQADGSKYMVTFEAFDAMDPSDVYFLGTFYAVVEEMNIKGNNYWTLYRYSASRPW